jgi:hypothetical protein
MFRTVSLSIFRSSHCKHSNAICHTGLLTACEQDQDETLSKFVWHIPLLCVQWKIPDDGQRNCPKHVEFHSKNKFKKLVHLVAFIIRKFIMMHSHMNVKVNHLTNLKKGKARGHPSSPETGTRRFVCSKGWAGRFPWMAPCPTKSYLSLVTHCARAIQNRSFIYSTIVPAGLQQVIFMRKLLVRLILLYYLSLYQWNDLKGMSYIFRKQKSKIRETLHFLCVYKWKFQFWILKVRET